jgi:hypothetical protein
MTVMAARVTRVVICGSTGSDLTGNGGGLAIVVARLGLAVIPGGHVRRTVRPGCRYRCTLTNSRSYTHQILSSSSSLTPRPPHLSSP